MACLPSSVRLASHCLANVEEVSGIDRRFADGPLTDPSNGIVTSGAVAAIGSAKRGQTTSEAPVATARGRPGRSESPGAASADDRNSSNSALSTGLSQVPVFRRTAASRGTVVLRASFCNHCANDTLSAAVDHHGENRNGRHRAHTVCVGRMYRPPNCGRRPSVGSELVARCQRRRRRLKRVSGGRCPLWCRPFVSRLINHPPRRRV
jgi:hypothetical protein